MIENLRMDEIKLGVYVIPLEIPTLQSCSKWRNKKQGIMASNCNPSTWEVDEAISEIQG